MLEAVRPLLAAALKVEIALLAAPVATQVAVLATAVAAIAVVQSVGGAY